MGGCLQSLALSVAVFLGEDVNSFHCLLWAKKRIFPESSQCLYISQSCQLESGGRDGMPRTNTSSRLLEAKNKPDSPGNAIIVSLLQPDGKLENCASRHHKRQRKRTHTSQTAKVIHFIPSSSSSSYARKKHS